ncbi:hypothetical protein [Ruegeria atlantica]|uniref:hypothetical protein n=1 Tax=Ruegeria atlantica TaxID=81569 RepID=UPI00147A36D5|nr:hypothetical protein [Ruegeria atlantica]
MKVVKPSFQTELEIGDLTLSDGIAFAQQAEALVLARWRHMSDYWSAFCKRGIQTNMLINLDTVKDVGEVTPAPEPANGEKMTQMPEVL